jgi:hypothetical protein
LAAGFGDRVLSSVLDLVVAPGDVVGLIPAEDCTIRLSPPTATVGHLPHGHLPGRHREDPESSDLLGHLVVG